MNITDLLNQNKQNQTDLPEEEEWINGTFILLFV